MEIISWQFALFVIITLLIYYRLDRRGQNYWLLAISYVFYFLWDIRFAAALILSTVINFYIAQRIRAKEQKHKGWFLTGIIINVSALVFFRLGVSGYAYTIINTITRLGGASSAIDFNVLLPLGFSFYTLQAISYLADVYQQQLPPSCNLIDFSLYMAYFPKMVSGPIERARTFLPKLAQNRIVDNKLLSQSFTQIVIGLFRKILVAGILSRHIPIHFFSNATSYPPSELALGMLFYAFWIYNDFAGYTSIVRGVSGLFGIELSQNFLTPYFSRNFTEFWNRWHISFSHWLRDYVFFPLSRTLLRHNPKRNHWINIVIPPMATMLISGFWHNAGFYMLMWGALHGIYQIIERVLANIRPSLPPEKRPVWRQAIDMAVCFTLTLFTWVAFGSNSLSRAFTFWGALFTSSGTKPLSTTPIADGIVMLVISLLIDVGQYHYKDEVFFLKAPKLVQAAILALFLMVMFFNSIWNYSPVTSFIYQGF